MVTIPYIFELYVSSAETLITYVESISKSGLVINLTAPEIESTENDSKSSSDSIL